MKILIVDDNEQVLSNMKKLLESLYPDAKVITTEDATEAFDFAIAEKPDYCIIDFRLKSADGVVLASRIKHFLPEAHIAILSAFKKPTYISEKPFDVWIEKNENIFSIIDFFTGKK